MKINNNYLLTACVAILLVICFLSVYVPVTHQDNANATTDTTSVDKSK